ncbi:MAG: PH domain-containing protein [Gordonia sp. (in: high G+C Gram-positive bacteria)]|uniref:PH domain-containing protein n=1 Tax=Gordonia TaxID=2053 RepID=UPI00326618D8
MTESAQVFSVSRLAYFSIPVALLLVVMLMGISVPGFAWTLVVPLALAWWIRRLKTIVDGQGITAVGTFATTRIPWHDVDGLQFPKWSAVRVVLTDGSSVRLPAVGFADLPAISKASGGRVPDPFAAERDARLAVR